MFTVSKPIYLKKLNKEKNITAFFAANFDCDGDNAILTIAGSSAYRVSVNGDFACFGPSKAVKGYAKFDTVDISKYVSFGLNQIVIECATYEDSSSDNFIQAEVFSDNKAVAATGYNFIGFLDVERLKASNCGEKYNISGSSMIQTQVDVVTEIPILIKRDVPYPEYKIIKSTTKIKEPVNIVNTYELNFANKVCGFINIEFFAEKPVEFDILNENDEYLMSIKTIDGEYIRESFNPYKVSKLKICVSNGSLSLKNAYIKEYSYYNGKKPKNTTESYDIEFYTQFSEFIADYNDYRFSNVNFDEHLLSFQKYEKLYTKENKLTEAFLNIPLYATDTDIKNSMYKQILEKTLNDNQDISQIKYKRILRSLE